eukprot:243010_1
MAPGAMKNLTKMSRDLSNRRILIYFVALCYPVTMGTSLYYAFKSQTVQPWHIKHKSKINIMEKSETIQKNRRHIIDEVFNIYNGRPNSKTEFIYDKDAVFEDPTVYVVGKKSITAVILGMPVIFSECKTYPETHEIEHYEDSIVMKFDCTFAISPWIRLTWPSTQYLKLNEKNDKIVRHTDMWNNTPIYRFRQSEKVVKYINGNYICRVIFGLASGRFIE